MYNSREYEELETRTRIFLRNESIFNFLGNAASWMFFPIFIPYAFLNSFLGWTLENLEMWVVLVLINAFWLLVFIKTGKKVNAYRVEDNEWATLYSHLILENLEKRSKARRESLKREYRKEAFKYAKKFLECIRKRWIIGSFKLVQDSFGKPLNEFKKNLQYRIIPILKDGNEEELEKVEHIIRNLLYKSKNLKLKDIVTLNEQMLKLPTTEPLRMNFYNKIKNFLDVHKILKNVLVVLTFVVVSCAFYYFSVTHLEIAKDVVFGCTVALFVGFITVYYTRKPKG